jgi:hypothetical protein
MARNESGSRLWNPRVVHYTALAVSFGLILWLGRDQWFFGDDWAILVPRLDGAVMLPHVGHWNLIPALLFQGVRNLFGLGSYLPFLALAVVAHLVLCHLLWRILRRVGVEPWIATLLSILLMLFGGGAENIFWAFQVGFMGAVAIGLAVVLLFDRPRMTVATGTAIVVLSVLAPMFSGTAIPILVGAAILGWIRHGFVRAALLLVPTATSYLLWYFLIAREHPTAAGGLTGVGELPRAAAYAAAMFAAGLGRALPLIWLGVLPALAVIVWFVMTVRRRITSVAAPAYALVFSSLAFVGLTAVSRVGFGMTSAAAERYAYVTLAVLLPALGIMLSWVAARSRAWFVTVVVVLIALIGYNTGFLAVAAGEQGQRDQASKSRIMTVLETELANPGDTALLDAPADPTWSPDARGSDLLRLYRDGQLPLN